MLPRTIANQPNRHFKSHLTAYLLQHPLKYSIGISESLVPQNSQGASHDLIKFDLTEHSEVVVAVIAVGHWSYQVREGVVDVLTESKGACCWKGGGDLLEVGGKLNLPGSKQGLWCTSIDFLDPS